jgi:SAM-dependent methyltransferase
MAALMTSWVRARYRQALFRPGLLSFLINPYHLARSSLWRAMTHLAPVAGGGRLLDVGCGTKPYRSLFVVDEYIGLEYDTPGNRAEKSAELWYDGGRFPCADASFDIVLCNQVLEHVFEPGVFLAEIARVLKPGGRLLLTVPFVWDEHEQPHDFARYTRFGLQHLLGKAGMTVVTHHTTLAGGRSLAQLLTAMLHKRLTRSCWKWLYHPLSTAIAFPANIFGTTFARLIPATPDLYLDHVLLAQKGATPVVKS